MPKPTGKNIPKKHHYVNQAYLRNFFNSQGMLEVFDLEQGWIDSKGTKRVAFEEWLYWLPDASDELGVEKWLGPIEESSKRVIDQILANKAPYVGPDLMRFITYISTMAARNPLFKRQLEAGDERLRGLSDKERVAWLQQLGSIKFVPSSDVATKANDQDIEQFFKGNWDDEASQQKRYIVYFYWLSKTILDTLWQRSWTVLESTDSSEIFVTSDNPVGLIGGLPGQSGDWLQGFQDPRLQVTLPLSPSILLVGSVSKYAPKHATADGRMVSTYNWGTIQHSTQVYASRRNFTWHFPELDGHLQSIDLTRHAQSILRPRIPDILRD